MARLNSLDDRVVPAIRRPVQAFGERHPVAARRAPLIWIGLLVVFAVLNLLEGDTTLALLFVIAASMTTSTRWTERRQAASGPKV